MKYVLKIFALICFLPFGSSALESDLPDCGSGVRHNCFGTEDFFKGASQYTYVGEFKDGKWHGRGTYSSHNTYTGERYVGEFRDGKKHGKGRYTHNSYDVEYVGEYVNGKKHGKGRYDDGIYVYDGEFKNDKKHGYGTTSNDYGIHYGEYRNGLRHGQGTAKSYSGDERTYKGEYQNGKKHGQGTETWQNTLSWTPSYLDRFTYEGQWKDGRWHGYGTLSSDRGYLYVGEFEKGLMHGQGTETLENGQVKQGIWKEDRFQEPIKPDSPRVAEKSPSNEQQIISDSTKLAVTSSGSGFAITRSGHVITNNHVIEGCSEIKIHTEGQAMSVNVLAFDPINDVALLKGDFRPVNALPLSSSNPQLLQDVYVAGYPFGQQISTSVKVTKGIVSSLAGAGNNFSNLQIDAALQAGNSGGPILDQKGNVIGIAIAKLDVKKALANLGSIPENTNFGVKASVVRNLVDDIKASLPKPNRSDLSKSTLGEMIKNGVYYISCWKSRT